MFELKLSGKTSEEKYAASLCTKARQMFFLSIYDYLRNEFDFWKIHGILNTSGLVQSK